jgi:predicted secreted protein
MHWVVLAGAYIILWFLTLQILLPMGIRARHEMGEDTAGIGDPGAPPNPRLVLKALLATLVAAVIWSIFYALVLAGVINA